MKPFAIITSLAFAFATPAHAEQLTASQALLIQKKAASGDFAARSQWIALTYYLQGVVEGSVVYQQTLIEQKKSPLFCPPKKKEYSTDELIGFLRKNQNANHNEPAAMVIMKAYAARYPCNT